VKDIALSVVPMMDEVAPDTVRSAGNDIDVFVYSYFIGTDVIAVDTKGISVCPPAGSIDELICPIDKVYKPFTVFDTLFTSNVVDLLKLIA
jgi:hypothetical protein